MNNHFLPVLSEPPFTTSLRIGDMIDFREIIGGGIGATIFHVSRGWKVIGFRHDPTTFRQNLAVLEKGDRIINISIWDVVKVIAREYV